MPFKFHQPHRHRVPKAKYRVTNWAEYERGLVNRGDIRFWISQEAIEAWQAPYRKTPGGQMRFSNLAIETILMLGALLRLPLRQSEGFLRSLMELMQLCLPVPDHSTLARRRLTMKVGAQSLPRKGIVDIVIDSTGLKFYGAGEWSRTKHGESRRSWRKLHLSLNAASSEIVFHELTDDDTSDAAMAGKLVSGSGGRIGRVIADGAYDGDRFGRAFRLDVIRGDDGRLTQAWQSMPYSLEQPGGFIGISMFGKFTFQRVENLKVVLRAPEQVLELDDRVIEVWSMTIRRHG